MAAIPGRYDRLSYCFFCDSTNTKHVSDHIQCNVMTKTYVHTVCNGCVKEKKEGQINIRKIANES